MKLINQDIQQLLPTETLILHKKLIENTFIYYFTTSKTPNLLV